MSNKQVASYRGRKINMNIVGFFGLFGGLALFLHGIGIVKCTFTVPVAFTAAAGAGMCLLAFLLACLLSLKIRKIAPKELLSGE